MLGLGPRRDQRAELMIVHGQADGIALVQHEVAERCGHILGKFKLAYPAPLTPSPLPQGARGKG